MLAAFFSVLSIDNLTVTPHLAAIAVDVFASSVLQMMHNILCVSRGEPVPERDAVV